MNLQLTFNPCQVISSSSQTITQERIWKEDYLKLQKYHYEIVNQLNKKITEREYEIQLLKNQIDKINATISTIDSNKTLNEQIKQNIQQNKKPSIISSSSIEQLITTSQCNVQIILNSKIETLNYKLQELQIEKQYSQMKQQQSALQNIKLKREITKFKAKQDIPHFDKSTNTEELISSANMTQSVYYSNNYLLKSLQIQPKRQLQTNIQTNLITSTIVKQNKMTESVNVSKYLNKTTTDLSRVTMVNSPKHHSRISSEISNSNKITPKLTKQKWLQLKNNFNSLRQQHESLRLFLKTK